MLIKIFGTKGEGKTTLSLWLKKVLEEKGVVVEVPAEEFESESLGPGEDLKDDEIERRFKKFAEKGPMKVEVRTIPTRGETLAPYANQPGVNQSGANQSGANQAGANQSD